MGVLGALSNFEVERMGQWTGKDENGIPQGEVSPVSDIHNLELILLINELVKPDFKKALNNVKCKHFR